MIGCQFCHAVISEPCRSPITARDCKAAPVSEHLVAARSTISELETRIESLLSDNGEVALMHIKAEQALTSERQRREEAEALLGRWCHGFSVTLDGRGIKPATNAYFRKYEPLPADREEERGGNE